MKKISNFLKKGDIIDIVAPASTSSAEDLATAVAWLKQLGYVPRVPKDLLQPQLFFANSDQKRFLQLKKALTNSSSKVVWCLRGGYGSIRLVPALLKLKKPTTKILIGMSDITVLHQFLNQKWNWPSVHGPIFARQKSRLDEQVENDQELFGLLEGSKDYIIFENLIALNSVAKKNKKTIKAKVRGGNLCTFCSMLATSLHPKIDGDFLFFEDISERGYKVDRMLNQLSQAGIFKKCRGIFFGDFTTSNEADGTNLVWPVIEAFFKESLIPVFRGIESDHSRNQRPLFLNTRAELQYNNQKPILKVFSS